MEKVKAWIKDWLRKKTGATSEIAHLQRYLLACRQKVVLLKLRDKRSQDELARMLDTQRNCTQRQEIVDLRSQNKNLRRRLDDLL